MLTENKLTSFSSQMVSSENLETENKILCAVKERKIKLWILPFYNQETRTSQANVMTSYARFLAARLEMDLVNVYQGISSKFIIGFADVTMYTYLLLIFLGLCKLQDETLTALNKSDLKLKTEQNPEFASKTVKRYTHSIHSARRQRA